MKNRILDRFVFQEIIKLLPKRTHKSKNKESPRKLKLKITCGWCKTVGRQFRKSITQSSDRKKIGENRANDFFTNKNLVNLHSFILKK